VTVFGRALHLALSGANEDGRRNAFELVFVT